MLTELQHIIGDNCKSNGTMRAREAVTAKLLHI